MSIMEELYLKRVLEWTYKNLNFNDYLTMLRESGITTEEARELREV